MVSVYLCFSLACITKYNAIFFGVGILIFMWAQKLTLRPMFASRHFIFSLIILFLTQLPVFVWNFENQFSSFQFHLNERLDTELSTTSFLKNSSIFILAAALSISPLVAINLYTKKNKIKLGEVDRLAMSCAYYVLLVTICSCIFLSIFTNVLYYWSVVGFILYAIFLYFFVKSGKSFFNYLMVSLFFYY